MNPLQELNNKLIQMSQLTEAQSNYQKSLMLLSALKSGQITLDDFEMTNGGWQLRIPAPVQPAPQIIVEEVPDEVPATN